MHNVYEDNTFHEHEHEHKVLSGVYGYVKTHEIVGILGRNGCGKTTLFKYIFGLFGDDKGMVKINNRVIKKRDRWKFIGYLPQTSFLPVDLRVNQAIRLFLASEKAERLFEDQRIMELRRNKIGTLSMGERRYLEICILLHLDRQFLLLDEPFSHIEPIYASFIRDQIKKHQQTTGIILSDHKHLDLRDLCTRIIVMNDGTLKEIKNSDDVLIQSGYLPGG